MHISDAAEAKIHPRRCQSALGVQRVGTAYAKECAISQRHERFDAAASNGHPWRAHKASLGEQTVGSPDAHYDICWISCIRTACLLLGGFWCMLTVQAVSAMQTCKWQ
jgi:hypothetical protein